MKVSRCVLVMAITGVVVGCASQTRCGDPGEIVAGAPDKPTMYDLESSADALVQKMLRHAQFLKNYKAAKDAKGGKLPIVCFGLLDNKCTQNEADPNIVRPRLRAITDTVRAELFDSEIFEIRDDEATDAIKARITMGADGGIENSSELMKTLGEHESPDFILLGDFRHFADVGGYHTYRLRLAIHNLHTGKVVWEGIQTKVKL